LQEYTCREGLGLKGVGSWKSRMKIIMKRRGHPSSDGNEGRESLMTKGMGKVKG